MTYILLSSNKKLVTLSRFWFSPSGEIKRETGEKPVQFPLL